MKLIKSKVELIQQGEGLSGLYSHIEFCGRTCYKSEDKITEASAIVFIQNLIGRGHTAMLEQGTVYLEVADEAVDNEWVNKYAVNPYSRIVPYTNEVGNFWCVTTNFRVINENGWDEDLNYLVEPTEHHEKRYTFKLTTDRGVSHELVRHRVFSFAQESTRYCNYSKDKFGNELTFICPSWLNLNLGRYEFITKEGETVSIAGDGYFKSSLDTDKDVRILKSMLDSEEAYIGLLAEGCSPQEARQVLPNTLKTEICMTGFASDWKKFFALRYFEVTGKAHPDMKLLATMMKEECEKANIWNDIIKDNNEN